METKSRFKVSFIIERITEPETFAIVDAEVSDEGLRDSDRFVDALKQGVTRWVETTEPGKACFSYAGNDLNIGDLLSYLNPSLQKILESFGIFNFCLDETNVEKPENWHYDTTLVNEIPD